ncbi:hypothetical protein N9H37_02440 [Congregibacter sp.]|nr:hypothetical protein [Congregibacter sp.]MDA8962192.1 hypothetical protein [Congregibacter sp.]
MIISNEFKYLFIETPHTGSTAISAELKRHYGGQEILHKHANFHEFKKIATQAQSDYFVFAGVRNPLDEAQSLYFKFLTNHKKNYTDPAKALENGGWVTKRKRQIFKLVQGTQDFTLFVESFYGFVYTSNININKKHCDYILRFESLSSDFLEVLRQVGASPVRALPVINKTQEKESANFCMSAATYKRLLKCFGPFMREWGYDFPEEYSSTVSRSDLVVYWAAKLARGFYSEYVKEGPLGNMLGLRNILE